MKRIITLLLLAVSLLAQADDVTVRLPQPMPPGPLDPVWAEDECPLLAVACLGYFENLDALRSSAFFPLLVSAYPPLADIDRIAVDTGNGPLWYVEPLTEAMSLAINEYDFDMFMGIRAEDDGAVLYRTENAAPMLLRMTAADPGQLKINAVDDEGHRLTWIPTVAPTTAELRYPDPEVVPITMDVVTWRIDPGRAYVADLGGSQRATMRFYLDGRVFINGEPGRYRAFHLDDGSEAMGLWLEDAAGRQTSARITPFEGADRAFNFERVDGYNLGLADFVTFLPQ